MVKASVANALFLASTGTFFLLWWTVDLLSFAWFLILSILSLPITREVADLLIKKYKLGLRPSGGNGAFVVITGASRGIGKAIALQYVRDGFNVFAGVRKEADGKALESEAASITSSSETKSSGSLRHIILDVIDQNSVDEAAQVVAKAVGDEGVSILVNNAGVALGGGSGTGELAPIELQPTEAHSKIIDVNYLGPVRVTKAFLPLLRKAANRGSWTSRIVNVSSVAGTYTTPLMASYCASKYALEGWSNGLRLEVEDLGVDVVVVNPGFIRTDMFEKDVGTFDDKAYLDRLSASGLEVYSRLAAFGRVMSKMGQADAISPEPVGELLSFIAHLHSRDLRTRYWVGKNTGAFPIFQHLPERFIDTFLHPITLRIYGQPN